MTLINVADLKDPDDPKGRTIREVNAEKTHAIKLGSLVEINCPTHESHGARMFIVFQGRDCDQTPLYWLSGEREEKPNPSYPFNKWFGGWPEESLIVIKEN